MSNIVFPTDIPSKANPTTSDILLIADSSDNSELKKITIGDITTDIGAGIIVDGSASLTTTYSSTQINTLNGAQDTTISGNYTTLNNAKLNKAGQLRTGNGAWKTIYNDASGNEVELALGASGTVLNSNGATSAPTWVAPSVSISGQTEDTTGDMSADFLLAYDTSAGANRKQKPQVYTASDAEATAGTVTTKWITPAQLENKAINSKVIGFSRDANATSGTVTYTHNLGKIPRSIRLDGVGTGNYGEMSAGAYGGGTQYAIGKDSSANIYSGAVSAYAYTSLNAGNSGTISNVTTTTFDIVWTKAGSPTSNPYTFIAIVQ